MRRMFFCDQLDARVAERRDSRTGSPIKLNRQRKGVTRDCSVGSYATCYGRRGRAYKFVRRTDSITDKIQMCLCNR